MESNCCTSNSVCIAEEKPKQVKRPLIWFCEDMIKRYDEAYKNISVNTNTVDFRDCPYCKTCVPNYCVIEYVDDFDHLIGFECVRCLLGKTSKYRGDYMKTLGKNFKDMVNCIRRLENDDKTKENKPIMIIIKIEKDLEDGELLCGCIDVCRGRCGEKRWYEE